MVRTSATWVAVALCGAALTGQQVEPRFDVASIKTNLSEVPLGGGSGGGAIGRRGQRFVAVNAPLRDIIRHAFDLEPFQRIEGGPAWLTTRYDINATIPDSPTSADLSRAMLRSLLAERFKLSVRREAREQRLFALVVARSDKRLGPSLKASTTDCRAVVESDSASKDPARAVENLVKGLSPACDMVYQPYRARIVGSARPISDLARILSRVPTLGAPVIDRTGLSGAYDFEVTYSPAPLSAAPDQPDASRTSLFVALQEQLGLRLESTRGSVDVLVIDSVSPPTEN